MPNQKARERAKRSPKEPTSPPDHVDEAEGIAKRLYEHADSDEVILLFLLLRSLCYEEDMSTRKGILYTVEAVLMPTIHAATDAVNAECQKALDEMRKEGRE